MTDRNERSDKSSSGKKATTRAENQEQPQHPDLGERAEPEAEKSTTARPRGHTEEPGRTL
jgi:hypothetical protein